MIEYWDRLLKDLQAPMPVWVGLVLIGMLWLNSRTDRTVSELRDLVAGMHRKLCPEPVSYSEYFKAPDEGK